MEVTDVDHDPTPTSLVVERERLDAHVGRKARGDPLPDGVDGDLRRVVGHGGG
jgi:hypothetical protein